MKFKHSFTSLLFVSAVLIFFASACKKENDDNNTTISPYNGKTTAIFNSAVTYGTVTDIEGNIYKTVTIGNQTWMAENLRTTRYNDSTEIPNIIDSIEWGKSNTGAYCNYKNSSSTVEIATNGRLYNFHAVNTGKLAPLGWHIPNENEWEQLAQYLGGTELAGGKLKESGFLHWLSPNTAATNESGFTALPCGNRFGSGEFNNKYSNKGFDGFWWSSTDYNSDFAFHAELDFYNSRFEGGFLFKTFGMSIRCVKN